MRLLRSSVIGTLAAAWNAAIALAGFSRLPETRWEVCCLYTTNRRTEEFLKSEAVVAGNYWPAACHSLMSLALADAEEPAAHLWHMCYQFSLLLGKNKKDGRLSRKGIRTASKSQGILRRFLLKVIKFSPEERVTWAQYAALWAMHALCKKTGLDQGEQRILLKGCDRGNCGPEECADLVADHAKVVFEDSDNWLYWSDESLASRIFLSEALQLVEPEDWTIPNGITEHRKELWTRFVRRVPLYPGVGSMREEEEFGTQAMQQAERAVEFLERELPAFKVLQLMGENRRQVEEDKAATAKGKLRAGSWALGESRGCAAKRPSWSTSPISGGRRPGWSRNVRYAAQFEGTPRTPYGLFAAPVSSDVIWSRKCAVVYSWADLPWASCAPIVDECFGPNKSESIDYWKVSGVVRMGNTCRIVMNRAVLRPVLDAVLLGEDCKSSLGAGGQDVSDVWKLWPATYHASPLAVDLLVKVVVDGLLWDYYSAVSKLGSLMREGSQLEDSLGKIATLVARIFYYLSNASPFHKGNHVATTVLHHALWMRLATVGTRWKSNSAARKTGREVLRCIGLWRNGSFPVEECLAVRDANDWLTGHLYGTLLDHPDVRSPGQLAGCVAGALRKPR